VSGDQGKPRVDPTRDGRWGVRYYHRGRPAGGTVGLGWATRDEAEQARPSRGDYTTEVFERWGEGVQWIGRPEREVVVTVEGDVL
jgi:hypothetical protein